MRKNQFPPAATGGGDTLVCGVLPASATAYAVESCPGTAASAGGTDALAMGDAADASGDYAIALGPATPENGDPEGPTVVSANYGIAIGSGVNVSAADAIAIGRFADATGIGAVAIGFGTDIDRSHSAQATGNYSIALGTDVIASGVNSVAIGEEARSPQVGQYSYASASSLGARQGKNQFVRFVCHGKTTNNTATKINPDGGTTNRMILPTRTTWRFRIMCSAQAQSTLGAQEAHTTEFTGAIKRDSATTTALLGSVTEGTVLEDAGAAAWQFAVTADDTLEALQIEVTGENSHTIFWTAVVDICQTTSDNA